MSNSMGDEKQDHPQGKGKTIQSVEQQLKDFPLAEIQKQLSSSANGLSQAEAQKRIEKYGYNELQEKKGNPLLKFLSYFWGPIPIMIIIAAVLSGILQHWPDLGVIVALLVLNAVVGFREEYQAGNVIAALKKSSRSRPKSSEIATGQASPPARLCPAML
jgi:H+-transporting ATPase